MAALDTPTRFAFYARVSTEDAQDPSLSIPRQLSTCEREASAMGRVVATYWDIESGRIDLRRRGNGADGKAFGVTTPRDGGIVDLLRDAARPDPPFDAVIVESIDRLSRMTADATQIERELEQRDIGLFDEPMVTNATSILTRRVKQGVAEWYVRDLIEKSRRGMEESVRQGGLSGEVCVVVVIELRAGVWPAAMGAPEGRASWPAPQTAWERNHHHEHDVI